MPVKVGENAHSWHEQENYCVQMDSGIILYGFKSEDQIKQGMKKQRVSYFRKSIDEYLDEI